ncbi:hypothetical protein DL764_009497 [Monosporascus ibericus]|uniref:Rhodopsin domain-containing protein n=1 Tax=Monosporascus ibericus TaxID=155417 RepID=A0A4Q4SUU8_9PEZI|nr:hypothetical protein DL764_009497 [Monosporascus ibericus]
MSRAQTHEGDIELTRLSLHILSMGSLGFNGLGVHAWEMPLEIYERFSLSMYASSPTYMVCNGLAKLSLLTFYLKLSPQAWFRYSVWATIGIVISYTPTITLLLIFSCNPIRMSWDTSLMDGDCIDRPALYMATAVANIVTDCILFVLPLKMVIGLEMRWAQKAIALMVFTIGSILVLLVPLLSSPDQPWDTAPASLWVFVEANLFIICGSMPTLRRFCRYLAPRFFGESQSKPSAERGPSSSGGRSSNRNVARKTRNQYEKFSDSNELYAMSGRGRSKNQRAMTVEIATGRASGDDNRSDKAIIENAQIVQTRTVSVAYE